MSEAASDAASEVATAAAREVASEVATAAARDAATICQASIHWAAACES